MQKKAGVVKTIFFILIILIIIFLIVLSLVYFFILNPAQKKPNIENPLEGISSESGEVPIEDIEIEPMFISYILNEAGAWKLHADPFNGEEAIINFEIEDGTNYYSKIDDSIETFEGISLEADLEFQTEKKEIIMAILSSDPGDYFVESIQNGETQVEITTDELELLMKGYPGFYNSLEIEED